jgi:hypothetical protein
MKQGYKKSGNWASASPTPSLAKSDDLTAEKTSQIFSSDLGRVPKAGGVGTFLFTQRLYAIKIVPGETMKRILLILSLIMTLLSACTATALATTPAPARTDIFVTAPATEPIPTSTAAIPNAKLPAAPFEAETYINGTAGFALDYPAGWTVREMAIGERGSQVQFLSSPDLAEAATVPAGQTRVVAAIDQWDPKNDLAAFVAQRKTAWEASGFTILEEQSLTLELGLQAVEFTVQTAESTVIFLIAALPERYLVLSGEGDLELAKEIVERVRPISR